MSALTTVDNNPGSSYVINITGAITLTAGTTLPALTNTSTVIINGNSHTLDGGSVQRGFLVYQGTVQINDLGISHTIAKGGAGAITGGGGAGVGGALFVASGATVTVSNVNLGSNAAQGGQGGISSSAGSGGGGGMGRQRRQRAQLRRHGRPAAPS